MDNRTPYKTAAELKIEQWEHDGLVALVGPLSRDALPVDMQTPECGTVRCIGGWVAHHAAANPYNYVHAVLLDRARVNGQRSGLTNLYWPGNRTGGYDATAPQAARAIVNFLVTGDPQWSAVMAEA